ncbi:MAG: dihydrolipoamide acetyltransferase family protein, partial [Acidimicrobiales bacterium]
MPQLGETVTEGTITRWFKNVGDAIAQDEVLFEVSTDKVDTEVPSPFSGTLAEIRVPEGDTVEVGTILAVLSDGSGSAAAAPAAAAAAAPAEAPPVETAPPPPPPAAAAPPPPPPERAPQVAAPAPSGPAPEAEPVPAASEGSTEGKVLSPVVRRLIAEYGIDASLVEGTGLGGRISRDDVQRYIEANKLSSLDPESGQADAVAPAAAPVPAAAAAVAAPVAAAAPVPVPATQAGIRDAVVPLSNIRLKTGEHMVMSKSVAPHTLTAIEVDYEAVEVIRRAHGDEFKAQEGFSLTYLPFIARATIDALREYPHLNASVGDRELVVHNYVNLGIAVDLDFQGLLAPVVRDADGKRMRSIARDIVDVARRARSKKLSPDDLSGGTFTLTNAGGYGTMMQFPI